MVPANYPISIAYSVYHLSLTHLLTRRWQTHQTSILGSFNIDLRPRIYQNGGPPRIIGFCNFPIQNDRSFGWMILVSIAQEFIRFILFYPGESSGGGYAL